MKNDAFDYKSNSEAETIELILYNYFETHYHYMTF
ncbi:hypothetical protein OKW21_005811 [Catalinimonas alkaloidigena]|nr:hypothetical protein [Catalinimonas alkaloidigena]